MAETFGILLAIALFVGLPVWLLWDAYGLPVAVAFASVELTLLSIMWKQK